MKELNYSVEGEKDNPAIVFLHGFLGSSAIWKDFVCFFQDKYQVITIDLPGHGNSPVFEETQEMSSSAMLVNDILVREKIHKVHLIGHSMGGYVALAFSKLYTNKTLSLTLFNSTAKADDKQKQSDRLKAVRVFDMNPSIFINEAVKNLFYDKNLEKLSREVDALTAIARETKVKGAQASLRGMRLREGLEGWLKEQDFPIHYIAGKYDNTVPYDTILAQLPKRAALTTLSNSGHMGFVEEKDKCIQTIKKFISDSA